MCIVPQSPLISLLPTSSLVKLPGSLLVVPFSNLSNIGSSSLSQRDPITVCVNLSVCVPPLLTVRDDISLKIFINSSSQLYSYSNSPLYRISRFTNIGPPFSSTLAPPSFESPLHNDNSISYRTAACRLFLILI